MSGPGQKDIRQKVCTWLHLIIVHLIIVYLIIVYMGASPGISWHQLPSSDKLP